MKAFSILVKDASTHAERSKKLAEIIHAQTPKSVINSFIEKGGERTCPTKPVSKVNERVVYRHGGPAKYMTHEEFIAEREQTAKRKMEDKARKEALKEERARKRQKRALEKREKQNVRTKKAKTLKSSTAPIDLMKDSEMQGEEHIEFLTFSDEEEEVEECAAALLNLNKSNAEGAQSTEEIHEKGQLKPAPAKPTEPIDSANIARGKWELKMEESVGD